MMGGYVMLPRVILDLLYPKDSLYFQMNNDTPDESLGGVWVRLNTNEYDVPTWRRIS